MEYGLCIFPCLFLRCTSNKYMVTKEIRLLTWQVTTWYSFTKLLLPQPELKTVCSSLVQQKKRTLHYLHFTLQSIYICVCGIFAAQNFKYI